MKFLVVLFALAAVAYSKPHKGGQQPQTFQVHVQPSQQAAAPPQPAPQVIRVITEHAPAPAPVAPPQAPPQTIHVRVESQPAAPPPPPPQPSGGGKNIILFIPNLGQQQTHGQAQGW